MITTNIIKLSEANEFKRLDAEFFQPKYIKFYQKITSKKNESLKEVVGGKNIVCGPFGSTILKKDYVKEGIPILRVLNLHNFFIDIKKLKFVSKDLALNLKRYNVEKDDLVVSQRGSIAEFSLVNDNFKKFIISANLISIKNSNKINPYYLLTVLNSKIVKIQLERLKSGQVQDKITTADIKNLIIPISDKKLQKTIESSIKIAENKKNQLEKTFNNILHLIKNIAGLKLVVSDENYSEINIGEANEFKRLDAEFFQPKYKELLKEILTKTYVTLGDKEYFDIQTGEYSEEYSQAGKNYIRSVDMSNKIRIEKETLLKTTKELNKKSLVKTGDILTSRVGSIGHLGFVDGTIDGSYISDNILRIRIKDNKMESDYLIAYLFLYGKVLMHMFSRGSIQQRLNQETLKDIPIIIADKKFQNKIKKDFRSFLKLDKEYKKLLKDSVSQVEKYFLEN